MDVDVILSTYLCTRATEATRLDPSYGKLWQHIAAMVLSGGKRLRPQLMLDSYRKYGGDDLQRVMPVAAAWEMLHASLLIHDDIMDGDLTRRGKPTIEAIYGNSGVAILAGDLCLSAANDLVLKSSLSSYLKVKVLQALQATYGQVVGGQLLDIEAASHDPLLVARYKTASYSFEGPMVCGAILAGASAKKLENIRNVAINQGVAYQLQNDLEDIDQDLAAGRNSSVIQAMQDLGSRDEAVQAIEQLVTKLAGVSVTLLVT